MFVCCESAEAAESPLTGVCVGAIGKFGLDGKVEATVLLGGKGWTTIFWVRTCGGGIACGKVTTGT